jgi:hypothetical protein
MRPVRRAGNVTTFVYRLSWNLVFWSSWNPQCMFRPLQGLFCLQIFGVFLSLAGKYKWFDNFSSFLSQCQIRGWNAVSCELIYFALRALRLTFNSFLTEVGSCNDIEFIRSQNPISLLQIGNCSCVIWLWLFARITLKCEREILQWISSALLEYILSIEEFPSMKFSLLQKQGSIQGILVTMQQLMSFLDVMVFAKLWGT